MKNVHAFWVEASCGEAVYLNPHDMDGYLCHSKLRHLLKGWMISPFPRFHESRGKSVLKVRVGFGADHHKIFQSSAILSGIDLMQRAVEHTQRRLQAFGLH
jgi:hypothetical protein